MTTKALIDSSHIFIVEGREVWRIAQVEPEDNTFEVHSNLFWVDLPVDIPREEFGLWTNSKYYDPKTKGFADFPPPEPVQPKTKGMTSL